MLNKIKDKLRKPLDQSARLLHKAGLTPATTTLFGLLSALASGAAYYGSKHSPELVYVALGLLVLSGYLDAIDGTMARLYSQVTAFGGVLDSVSDRIEEAAILFGIVAGGLVSIPIGLLALTGSLMVSYVRARAETEGVKMSGIGFAERPERLIILVAATAMQVIEAGLLIIAVISWFTVVQRIVNVYKQLR